MSEWFERFGGSSLCRGKNEPVSGECEQEIERRKGTGSSIRLIIIDPWERIDDRFDAAEFHVGRTGTPVIPQSAWSVGCRKNGDRHRGRSQSPLFLNRPGGSGVGRTGTGTADGASPRYSSIGLVGRVSEERGQTPRTEPVPVLPQSDRWIGRTGTDTVDFQISYELNHTFRVDEVEYRAHKLKSVGIHEGEFNMLFKSDTIN